MMLNDHFLMIEGKAGGIWASNRQLIKAARSTFSDSTKKRKFRRRRHDWYGRLIEYHDDKYRMLPYEVYPIIAAIRPAVWFLDRQACRSGASAAFIRFVWNVLDHTRNPDKYRLWHDMDSIYSRARVAV